MKGWWWLLPAAGADCLWRAAGAGPACRVLGEALPWEESREISLFIKAVRRRLYNISTSEQTPKVRLSYRRAHGSHRAPSLALFIPCYLGAVSQTPLACLVPLCGFPLRSLPLAPWI